MSKITIILKSGRELRFEADSIAVTRNTLTGLITEYEIKGIKSGEAPISLNPGDIYCVTQTIDESEETKNGSRYNQP